MTFFGFDPDELDDAAATIDQLFDGLADNVDIVAKVAGQVDSGELAADLSGQVDSAADKIAELVKYLRKKADDMRDAANRGPCRPPIPPDIFVPGEEINLPDILKKGEHLDLEKVRERLRKAEQVESPEGPDQRGKHGPQSPPKNTTVDDTDVGGGGSSGPGNQSGGGSQPTGPGGGGGGGGGGGSVGEPKRMEELTGPEKDLAYRAALYDAATVIAQRGGADAARHLRHFLDNTGEDLEIDVDRLLEEAPGLGDAVEDTIDENIKAAAEEALRTGKAVPIESPWEEYDITKGESENWSSAMGGVKHSVTGVAVPQPDGTVRIEYQVNVADRYSWDESRQSDFGGAAAADGQGGDPARAGVAKEYEISGSSETRTVVYDPATGRVTDSRLSSSGPVPYAVADR